MCQAQLYLFVFGKSTHRSWRQLSNSGVTVRSGKYCHRCLVSLWDSRLQNYLQTVITYVISRIKINYDNFNKLYFLFDGATLHYARIVQDYVHDVLDEEDEVQ